MARLLRKQRVSKSRRAVVISTGPNRVHAASREVLSGAHAGELDHHELLSKVCRYFCEGGTPSAIQKRLAQADGLRVSREVPYQLLAEAAANGWIEFNPPEEFSLAEKVRARYRWLHELRVAHTAIGNHVARIGAKALLETLQVHFANKEVHVGFSAGNTMRQLARHFAELLRRASPPLPRKIVFHAMVAGFDVFHPTNDPNAFFTYFEQDYVRHVELAFVGLHTPAVVEPEQVERLRGLDGIRQSFEHAAELNVVVTSARDWRDPHATLLRYLEKAGQSRDALKAAGAVGDILWQPLGMTGPVDVGAHLRAMTIMQVGELAGFIERGQRVLLVAGPCAECFQLKTEIVRTILSQPQHLITHLVIDSRCARELLDGSRHD
jgi:DNA-binding transcriptional regulator LsrR (DeoR family)